MGKEINVYFTVLITMFVIIAIIVSLFLIPAIRERLFPNSFNKDDSKTNIITDLSEDVTESKDSQGTSISGSFEGDDSQESINGTSVELEDNNSNDYDVATSSDVATSDESTNDLLYVTNPTLKPSASIRPTGTSVSSIPGVIEDGVCNVVNCNSTCISYGFYEGACLSNECYCLHKPLGTNPQLTKEMVNKVTYYCRKFGDLNTFDLGALIYRPSSLIENYNNVCYDSKTTSIYGCNENYIEVEMGTNEIQLATVTLIKNTRTSCSNLECGDYRSGGCVNAVCTCIVGITKEFLDYAITSYLIESNNVITKENLDILLKAYDENILTPDEEILLNIAIDNVQKQIYLSDNTLRLNYNLIT